MLVSLSEYAKSHDKSPDTIRRLAESGKLVTAKKIGRNWVVDQDEKYPVKKRSSKKQLSVLSLFSGCGGLDLGFEGGFATFREAVNTDMYPDWIDKEPHGWVTLPKTRFKTVFANDIRPDAEIAWSTYFKKNHNGASAKYVVDSIVDLVKAHKGGKKVFPNNVDVVTGGFPCQDFSVAGKRLGLYSDKCHNGIMSDAEVPCVENRGQLYMWMREVISITRPKIFIAENVKGLANLDDVKSIIEDDFRSIGDDGYLVVDARVLHAADYGVPQNRERVIFIGFNKSFLNKRALKELTSEIINLKYDPYPPATHSRSGGCRKLLPSTRLSQALSGLDEPHLSSDLAQQKYSKAKYLGRHLQGQSEVKIDGLGPTIRAEHHGNIEFRRLSRDNGGKIDEELDAGLEERRLTVRECARIQTFPDDFDFVILPKEDKRSLSASNAYKLIGNAVPPLLGYHIAKRLEKNWDLYFKDEKR